MGNNTGIKGYYREVLNMSNLKEFYETNQDFKDFCDKSLRNGEAESLDALLTNKIVQNVAEYYKSKEN